MTKVIIYGAIVTPYQVRTVVIYVLFMAEISKL